MCRPIALYLRHRSKESLNLTAEIRQPYCRIGNPGLAVKVNGRRSDFLAAGQVLNMATACANRSKIAAEILRDFRHICISPVFV